ncbi:MAG: tRNA pseudouridine(38-40) synthase TruA [Gemmatimonadetes bacterium]|nr:tRNA pseudouridine(38-40) synthase TruA [Gemmatimonadota bacterium]
MTARACYRLLLQYDGRGFHGWQSQPGLRTVQGDLEGALGEIFGLAVRVHGAGRTDAGVHARGQVAHLLAPARHTSLTLRRALNATLAPDVWIADVRRASPRFHARFDASARTYRYILGTEDLARSPFHRPYCWPVGPGVDGLRLQDAAAAVLGTHDFSGFARRGPGSRRCSVRSAEWGPDPLGWRFEITADRFLRGMVRGLVGAFVEVARGALGRDWLAARLRMADGGHAPQAAPPEGLFLWQVEYPAAPLLDSGRGEDAASRG